LAVLAIQSRQPSNLYFHKETLMPFEFITLKAMGDIAVVTLNRPDKRNAIHEALLVELDTFFQNFRSLPRPWS
jgi:1,4-dihydroxy-2-naphthoyl-CoA synthase